MDNRNIMFDEVIGTSTIGTLPPKIGEGSDPLNEIEGGRKQFRRRDGIVTSNTCLLGLISFLEPFQFDFPQSGEQQCRSRFTEQKNPGSIHQKGQRVRCSFIKHLLLISKILAEIERNDMDIGIVLIGMEFAQIRFGTKEKVFSLQQETKRRTYLRKLEDAEQGFL